MKCFGVMIWLMLLFVFTCTSSLHQLLEHQTIHFQLQLDPDFKDLLTVRDAKITEPSWLLIKSGHFMAFALLNILLFHLTGDLKRSLRDSLFIAVLSEILQLYFSRDGRIVDAAIDSLGILFAAIVILALRRDTGPTSGTNPK